MPFLLLANLVTSPSELPQTMPPAPQDEPVSAMPDSYIWRINGERRGSTSTADLAINAARNNAEPGDSMEVTNDRTGASVFSEIKPGMVVAKGGISTGAVVGIAAAAVAVLVGLFALSRGAKYP